MAEAEGNLTFNLDVLTDGETETPSLSDLYGIPVFTEEIAERASNVHQEKQRQLNQMQDVVFKTADESLKHVDIIKEQVFATDVLTKGNEKVLESPNSNATYLVVTIGLFCLIVIVTIIYAKKKKKERKTHLETIDDFF